MILWLILPAMSAWLLLAVTSYITENIGGAVSLVPLPVRYSRS